MFEKGYRSQELCCSKVIAYDFSSHFHAQSYNLRQGSNPGVPQTTEARRGPRHRDKTIPGLSTPQWDVFVRTLPIPIAVSFGEESTSDLVFSLERQPLSITKHLVSLTGMFGAVLIQNTENTGTHLYYSHDFTDSQKRQLCLLMATVHAISLASHI